MSNSFNWITEDLIRKVLLNDSNFKIKEFTIVSFNLSNISEAGGINFVSVLQRLKVTVQHLISHDNVEYSELKYVIKMFNRESRFGKFTNLVEIFEKEAIMYEKIVPALVGIWNGVGETVEFGPRCYMIMRNPVRAMIMEDLISENYELKPKQLGLTPPDVHTVISKIAKFHAASLEYLQQNPTLDEMFYHGIFSERYINQWRQCMYDCLYKTLIDEVALWPGFEKEAKTLKEWNGDVLLKASNILKHNSNEFNVLNHGDLWINNILLHLNINDARMVDYQFSCIAHPVQDLLYFIAHSLTEVDRVNNFHSTIEFYYDELMKNLTTLKYNLSIPTKREFMQQINNKMYVATFYIVFHMTILFLDDDQEFNMPLALQDSKEGMEYRKKLYRNPRYVSAVQKYLKFLNESNVLNVK